MAKNGRVITYGTLGLKPTDVIEYVTPPVPKAIMETLAFIQEIQRQVFSDDVERMVEAWRKSRTV